MRRLIIYKLPNTEKVLYNLGHLLDKVSQKNRVGIFCDSNIVEMVDKNLWTFSSNAFLPHDIASGDSDKDDLQSIIISDKLNLLNRAVLCIFNNTDLFTVIDNINSLSAVQDIIYMTIDIIDISELKLKINFQIDMFEKDNTKWQKIL